MPFVLHFSLSQVEAVHPGRKKEALCTQSTGADSMQPAVSTDISIWLVPFCAKAHICIEIVGISILNIAKCCKKRLECSVFQ